MFESFSVGVWIWIVAVLAVAGLIQGALGFGFPLIATPLVAMVSDMRTAVIMVLLPTMATTIYTMAQSGPLLPVLARFWVMPVFAFVGAFAGTWIFVAAPNAPYLLLLAVIIIVYLNLDRFSGGDWPRLRRHERAFAPLAGFAGGLCEGVSNVAAPPLIIFFLALRLPPATFVMALGICFVVGKATQLVTLSLHGGVSLSAWAATLPLVLAGLATSYLGARVRSRINAQTYRTWVKRALLAIALVLLARYGVQELGVRLPPRL